MVTDSASQRGDMSPRSACAKPLSYVWPTHSPAWPPQSPEPPTKPPPSPGAPPQEQPWATPLLTRHLSSWCGQQRRALVGLGAVPRGMKREGTLLRPDPLSFLF